MGITLFKASIFLQTGDLDKVPELYLGLPGIKEECVIFANCPLNINQQHQGSVQGEKSREWSSWTVNSVGPSGLRSRTQKLNSEAEGGNERSPICPLGPSSRLLPRSHFPSDIWLDTFQGRAHILGFGVCAVLGHYGFPPPTPGPACIWCSWKKVLEWVTRAGRSHTRHTMTWPQTRRLRYKDKYKYYSQNLCINKYFWGLLDHFIFWKIVSRTVKAYPKVFSLTG